MVILPTTISISYDVFIWDSNLTRIDATPEICAQVVKSCSGTCTKFRGCLTRVYVPAPSPKGIIAAIVISAVVGASIVGRFLWRKCYRRTPNTEYGAVGTIEMQTLPEQDGSVEAHALSQGELLSSSDPPTTYPTASATVVRGCEEQAVVVSSDEIVVQLTTTDSEEVLAI